MAKNSSLFGSAYALEAAAGAFTGGRSWKSIGYGREAMFVSSDTDGSQYRGSIEFGSESNDAGVTDSSPSTMAAVTLAAAPTSQLWNVVDGPAVLGSTVGDAQLTFAAPTHLASSDGVDSAVEAPAVNEASITAVNVVATNGQGAMGSNAGVIGELETGEVDDQE